MGCGGSCRCPNPTGQSSQRLGSRSYSDQTECRLWWLVSIFQSDRAESCGGSCRCLNPTEGSVSWCGFVDVPIRPTKVKWVPIDVPIQPAGVASCRCCSARFCSFYCAVFGFDLPINRINSFHLINICRTVKFIIFFKKNSLSLPTSPASSLDQLPSVAAPTKDRTLVIAQCSSCIHQCLIMHACATWACTASFF